MIELFEKRRDLGLDRSFLPAVPTRDNECRDIPDVELTNGFRRQYVQTTHRLDRLACQADGLDAKLTVAPHFGDRAVAVREAAVERRAGFPHAGSGLAQARGQRVGGGADAEEREVAEIPGRRSQPLADRPRQPDRLHFGDQPEQRVGGALVEPVPAGLVGLLAELHVDHLKDAPASALTGGERRRVEIACALATRPSYMLLDEPFAGIDPLAIDDIRKLILFLKDRGLGVLITDHNVRETLTIVDRASIMFDGEVMFEGTPQQVLASAVVRERYLGKDFS